MESPDVVVVLADAGGHPGGQHGAGHGGQREVSVQVSQVHSRSIKRHEAEAKILRIIRYPGWSDYISTSGLIFPKISR